MSYCVNCGVELDESAVRCALCGAPVLNAFAGEPQVPPPYPDRVFIPPQKGQRYVAFLLSMVLLIPNIVCGFANLLLPESGHWAVYVLASSTLVWILFLVPFLMKKIYPYLLLAFDTAAALGYIYIFYAYRTHDGWFLRVAVPLVMVFALICAFMVFWLTRAQRDWPYIAVAVLTEIGLYAMLVEAVFRSFYRQSPLVTFSFIIAASCAALIAFFLVIAKSRHFRAWLTRRFYV